MNESQREDIQLRVKKLGGSDATLESANAYAIWKMHKNLSVITLISATIPLLSLMPSGGLLFLVAWPLLLIAIACGLGMVLTGILSIVFLKDQKRRLLAGVSIAAVLFISLGILIYNALLK